MGGTHRRESRPAPEGTKAYSTVFVPRWGIGKAKAEARSDEPIAEPQKASAQAPKSGKKAKALRVLDLFSGTGSVGRVFQMEGYELVSVYSDPRFEPTIVADIMEWDYAAAFPPGHLMWSSLVRRASISAVPAPPSRGTWLLRRTWSSGP